MGSFIVKLKDADSDWYLIWSSVVDAPTTYGMTLAELKVFYEDEHGKEGMAELTDRLARVESKGVSARDESGPAEAFVRFNRAGAHETCLSVEQILDYYCRKRPRHGEGHKERPTGVSLRSRRGHGGG